MHEAFKPIMERMVGFNCRAVSASSINQVQYANANIKAKSLANWVKKEHHLEAEIRKYTIYTKALLKMPLASGSRLISLDQVAEDDD